MCYDEIHMETTIELMPPFGVFTVPRWLVEALNGVAIV